MILYKTKESEVVRVDGGANGQTLKKYSTSVTGDGVKTVFAIEHALGTEDILFEMNDGTEPVLIDYAVLDKNKINITFAIAPTNDEKYNVIIYGTDTSYENNFGSGSSDGNYPNDSQKLLPDAITDLALVSADHISITLSYTIPQNADNVIIYCSSSSDVNASNYEKSVVSTQNTCVVDGLNPNTEYYFAVYTENEAGTSESFAAISHTTEKERLYLYKNGGDYTDITGGWDSNDENIRNDNSKMIDLEAGNHYDTLWIVTNNQKIQNMAIGNNYSNLHLEYALETDCPTDKLKITIGFGYNNELINISKASIKTHTTSGFDSNAAFEDALANMESVGKFTFNIDCEGQYYLKFKIYDMYFE